MVSGWYLQDQATRCAQAFADLLHEDRAWVPALRELELSNVLRTTCLCQRQTAEQAQHVLKHIAQLPIDVDRQAVAPSVCWAWPCALA